MPIVTIQTNQSLDTQQQEQLIQGIVQATSDALSVDKERIDVLLHILAPGQTLTGGVYQRPFVRYQMEMLAGRTHEAKQALVKSYYEVTKELVANSELDVKTIIHNIQRDDLALGGALVG